MKRYIKQYYKHPQYKLLRKGIVDNIMKNGVKDGWRDISLQLRGQTMDTIKENVRRAYQENISVYDMFATNLNLPEIDPDTFVYRVAYDVYDDQIYVNVVKLVGGDIKGIEFDTVWENLNDHGFCRNHYVLDGLTSLFLATR